LIAAAFRPVALLPVGIISIALSLVAVIGSALWPVSFTAVTIIGSAMLPVSVVAVTIWPVALLALLLTPVLVLVGLPFLAWCIIFTAALAIPLVTVFILVFPFILIAALIKAGKAILAHHVFIIERFSRFNFLFYYHT
jgi:hypothetical protein